ncbi:MAG: ERMES complex subunit [Vezdaea aestivalis]|nr:MAG: ERMES complex subunit [Vezdaea aestivalis]
MAFNFNWSPLTADSSFYERAQELLTAALNKYPKPPIIVDDILVNELNLGSVPPDLEILEIGDLAEDKFRGIFKMSYSGDAFLTLKTKVQANPLNTYLSLTPSFASPQPLAASSGLTIPLQITLSSIRLSAFIILVFSKQKGVTLVFRNDPLESLKVSSTFDAIPFVRDYLQKEIEGQLRTLLMEELPAIIHRLSLRLWVPEFHDAETGGASAKASPASDEVPIDPLSSPPRNPLTVHDDCVDHSEVPTMSLDSESVENAPRFSHKNLVKLATLRDCQKTLSLFTPSIPDAVFRAWTGSSDRGQIPGANTPATPSLSRTHSSIGSFSSLHGFGQIGETSGTHSNRSSIYGGSFTGFASNPSRCQPHRRKRKHRVVNLRRTESFSDTDSISGESLTSATTTTAPISEPIVPAKIPEVDEEPVTPPLSPKQRVRWSPSGQSIDFGDSPRRGAEIAPLAQTQVDNYQESTRKGKQVAQLGATAPIATEKPAGSTELSSGLVQPSTFYNEKSRFHLVSAPKWNGRTSSMLTPSSDGNVDPEWIMRMAGEITRKAREDKSLQTPFWNPEDVQDAPPAYEAQ